MDDTEKLKLTIEKSQDVFASVVDKLKAADGTGGTRLFFPNGIELIKVEVDFGTGKALATVKVVVAGKDGVPGANTSNLLVEELDQADVSSAG
jgi:hypothetical protein